MEKCSKTNLKTISDTLFNKGIFEEIDEIVNKINNNKEILNQLCQKLGYL